MDTWKRFSPVICSERMYTTLEDLCRFRNEYKILPKLENAFDMFRMIMPRDIRVVMIGQSPYPGSCPATGDIYACGPAFLPAPSCATTPLTLRNIISELHRDLYPKRIGKPPKDVLLNWIDQGVMLLNSSLTLGACCPRYLEDHSILWHEIIEDIVCTICREVDPVFVLVGKDAWKFEGCMLPDTRVIMVSHPVARRDTSTPWLGSGVFSRVTDMMVQRGEDPIEWVDSS